MEITMNYLSTEDISNGGSEESFFCKTLKKNGKAC